MKRLLFITLITLLGATTTRAQILAVKTNALMDLGTVPNLGFELVTGNRTSLNVEGYIGYKVLGKKWNFQGATPEFRYYPQGKVMNKFFIGVGAMFAHYDMDFAREGFMGDVIGGGLTFGWVFPLTEYHWNIELEAGVGGIYYQHKHKWVDDKQTRRSYNQKGMNLIPYKIGVNICYILEYKHEVDSKLGRKMRKQKKAKAKEGLETEEQKTDDIKEKATTGEGEADAVTPAEGVNNLQQENTEDSEHTTT